MKQNEKIMLDRTGLVKGAIKNPHSRKCTMEGCTGWRIHVVWPNGKSTYPCSKGCRSIDENTMQIL